MVDENGVHLYPGKIEDSILRPRSATELWRFLGIATYCWKFIKGFANISAVHHASRSVTMMQLVWTEEHEGAFTELKRRLTTPYVLAYPRFDTPFMVEWDASATAIGAFLGQKQQEGKVNSIYYASWTINAAERNYSVYEREVLAVIFASKRFRMYLLSTEHSDS